MYGRTVVVRYQPKASNIHGSRQHTLLPGNNKLRLFCRDICHKYKAHKSAFEGSYYRNGHKRCIECETFLQWEGLRCPCCGRILRTRPHNTVSKGKLRLRTGLAGAVLGQTVLESKDPELTLIDQSHVVKKRDGQEIGEESHSGHSSIATFSVQSFHPS